MAITRTEYANGTWEEKADTPQEARELFEKHAPDLQKYGEQDFQRKWTEQNKVGFERVVDAQGIVTHVTADKVDESFASGNYRPMNRPTTVVPYLPWQADRRPGERYADYKRRKAETSQAGPTD